MPYFQHRFDNVEDYLHHRAPYLQVDEVVQIDSDQIITSSCVRNDSFYGQGHFPGTVILPGAMMQEMTTQSAGILIAAQFNPMQNYNTHDPFFNEYALGVLVKVNGARFRSFARPGDSLRIHVQLKEAIDGLFDFSGKVTRGSETLMKNSFQLTNILSSTLQGKAEVAS